MKHCNIYIEKREEYKYPRNNPVFNPSVRYPEYRFSELSSEKNIVYDMVRSSLYGFGLDEENYGTVKWNPLGKYIHQGDRVLVKPNMVKHFESIEQNECTLTHPSIVRAIIDYCFIAGAGEVVLGDAPIQNADIEMILQNNHYNDLLAFYHEKGCKIRFVDFRNYIVKKQFGIAHEIPATQNTAGVIQVDLGKYSYHYNPEEENEGVYETCGYDQVNINLNHHGEKHNYIVSEEILKADVVINIPKPKTHRFAGLTAAQKNFVGIVADKESVPHFMEGVKGVKGDETNQDSIYSRILHKYYKKYLHKNAQKMYKTAMFYYLVYRAILVFKRDSLYIHGQWHGNDTIWRSILDLNKIVLYADKNGIMNFENTQRAILNIGDMILVGEGQGPLSPTPKEYGMIMIADNMAAFDWVVCTLFGFEHSLLPTIQNGFADSMLCGLELKDVMIKSNIKKWDNISLREFHPDDKFRVKPHPFWEEILL